MNLFDLHDKPETLKGWKHRYQVPDIAYEEAVKKYRETGERSPDLEAIFAKNARHAYNYASLIRRRFRLGEPAIASFPSYAYDYARFVLERRFPLGEPVIIKDSSFAYEYAHNVIKGRWHEAESIIATNPYHAYLYAMHVLRTRWRKGEPVIAQSSYYKTQYEKRFGVEI